MEKEKTMYQALALIGGFLETYAYTCRDHVFANAQTGNIIKIGIAVAQYQFEDVLRYLLPVCAFVAGILCALRLQSADRILLTEAILLLAIGTIPQGIHENDLANVLISFLCAIQMEHFRTPATTVCTGNLRIISEQLACRRFAQAGRYGNVLFLFIFGTILDVLFTKYLGEKSVWILILPLCAALRAHRSMTDLARIEKAREMQ